MTGGRNMDSKFRDSHITGKHPSFEDGATKANTLMSLRRTGEERRVSQCSRHVYQFALVTAAAKCDMHSIMIIIELSYHIVIAIILIYRIVYRSKTVFDMS